MNEENAVDYFERNKLLINGINNCAEKGQLVRRTKGLIDSQTLKIILKTILRIILRIILF